MVDRIKSVKISTFCFKIEKEKRRILGGGSLFDGSILAIEGDIIVITMNFRLNYHGFLSSGDDRLKGKKKNEKNGFCFSFSSLEAKKNKINLDFPGSNDICFALR